MIWAASDAQPQLDVEPEHRQCASAAQYREEIRCRQMAHHVAMEEGTGRPVCWHHAMMARDEGILILSPRPWGARWARYTKERR